MSKSELVRVKLLLMKLAFPESFAPDFIQWHTGDGPAEQYFSKLEQESKSLCKELKWEP